jgi:glucose/arabinose dehydrogenase/PKD repeat protein
LFAFSGVQGSRALLACLIVTGSFSFLTLLPNAAAWSNVEVYKSGLDNPTALAFAPDGRIFFAERLTAKIRIVEGGNLLPDPFYTLNDTDIQDERGLLGLALDPDFPTSPYVYAYHTYNDAANGTVYNRIVRIRANGNVGEFLSVIFQTPPLSTATIHNGGVIAFGPDGKLYALIGENAWPLWSQDPMSPFGKVLRMNPDGSAPIDNPFVGNSSWDPLVYTYGHRNMFGIAFHPLSGGIFITENGPECNDEINLLIPGRNFGWGPSQSCVLPPNPPDLNTTNRDGPDPVLPIWWWASTICPTNAAIHNGSYFPAWRGDLFMGDCNRKTLHRLHLSPPNYDRVESDTPIWVAPDMILDVDAGPDGSIWFTTSTAIYRFWDSGQPPVASFTANPNPVVLGTPVQFNATESYDPDGTIVSYAWEFGDSTVDNGPTPMHAYQIPSNYTVNLTVTDNESYSSTTSLHVLVRPPQPAPLPPVAVFTFHPSPVATDVPVAFDASNSSDSDGTIRSYAWDFGDATKGAGKTETHSYRSRGTYRVALTVTDSENLTNTTTESVVVRAPPHAVIAIDPATIFIGTDVHFSGTGSSDPDGTIQAWTWDFGDSSSNTGPEVVHRYASKGRFTVNLTVENDVGMTNRTSSFVEVRNRPPQITSSAPEPGSVTMADGSNRTFAVTATDPDGDDLAYTWRIDGASRGGGPSLNFVPSSPGNYRVNVTVSDGTSSTSREWNVTVSPPNVSPEGVSLWPVAAVLAAIAGAAAFVGWRRRARGL